VVGLRPEEDGREEGKREEATAECQDEGREEMRKMLGFVLYIYVYMNVIAGHVGPGAFSGHCTCRATVPRMRPRHGPTVVPGWPMARYPPCWAVFVSCFFGPCPCRPTEPGPSGHL
jgi:hypothetical protein